MWIRFCRDFDWSPPVQGGRVTVAYRAGTTKNVTRDCADQAKLAGAATDVEAARKEVTNARRW